MYASPVELQIDSIIVDMFRRIQERGVRRLVIDALGDLASAATDPQRLHDYLYALVQHFAVSTHHERAELRDDGQRDLAATACRTR